MHDERGNIFPEKGRRNLKISSFIHCLAHAHLNGRKFCFFWRWMTELMLSRFKAQLCSLLKILSTFGLWKMKSFLEQRPPILTKSSFNCYALGWIQIHFQVSTFFCQGLSTWKYGVYLMIKSGNEIIWRGILTTLYDVKSNEVPSQRVASRPLRACVEVTKNSLSFVDA